MAITLGNLFAAVAGGVYGLLSKKGLKTFKDFQWWVAVDFLTAFAGLIIDLVSPYIALLVPGVEVAQAEFAVWAQSLVLSLFLMPVTALAGRIVRYFMPFE